MKFSILAAIIMISGLVATARGAESCKRYCNPDVSKPCGASCIPKDNYCRKNWTTSCAGVRPDREKGRVYDKPAFVSERPKG